MFLVNNEVNGMKDDRNSKGLEDKLSKVLTTDKQKAFLKNRMSGMNKAPRRWPPDMPLPPLASWPRG